MAAVLGLVIAAVAGVAAADAVPFDSEKYGEAKTSIVVEGVAGLGDLVLVVYPYPCEVSGAFESFEEKLKQRADARLELYGDDEEEYDGYLVVVEGEQFESTTNYEGPMARCYFFGLPRAEFPVEDGAIARLDAMSNEERWRLFSRDPAVVRTGVALAMDAVVKIYTERSRVVTYAVRREGEKLALEVVRWLWGSGKVQDPRKRSRGDVKVIDPYADDGEEEEVKYFAGSLIGAPWGAAADAGTPVSAGTAGAGEAKAVEAKAVEAKAVEAKTVEAKTVEAKAVEAARPEAASVADASTIDPRLVYGGACLLVAAGAGLLLRRRRP
ncbi:hypothetical protein OV203_05380 [Nannocystis sp. ILAH1]|uniref:hypothetical protein n=1 Tax=unclassified Nannocystis TaxID=2627009 RepID=UPI002270C828|nr:MULTISPECIES: hypothetical protein [unclassified Nannocystis]MCY0986539.1 hypothetical protein [Nannocystis sp. ILAH1]MCY1071419.1 hypothetical protein [Nannocystis sp. RBIL2]